MIRGGDLLQIWPCCLPQKTKVLGIVTGLPTLQTEFAMWRMFPSNSLCLEIQSLGRRSLAARGIAEGREGDLDPGTRLGAGAIVVVIGWLRAGPWEGRAGT